MKTSHLLIISFFVCAVCSCKKDNLSGEKSQYANLIIGNWKSTQQNIKVYDINSNVLLKDSTTIFTQANAGKSWTEIYNADGNAYITTFTKKLGATVATADTTSYLTYTILGANLQLKSNIGGNETKPISTLNLSDMQLQSIYTGSVNAGWGLDVNSSYKIIQATYYTRQ